MILAFGPRSRENPRGGYPGVFGLEASRVLQDPDEPFR